MEYSCVPAFTKGLFRGSACICLLFAVMVLCCCGWYSPSAIKENPATTGKTIMEIPLSKFSFSCPAPETREVKEYLHNYGLYREDVNYHPGRFAAPGYEIAVHAMVPENPGGTVFLLHGYYDHSGNLKHLANALLDSGFAVFMTDLPGHGLSGGKRGAIDDFHDYAKVFHAIFMHFHKTLPKPVYFAGHSTGCAVFLETLATFPETEKEFAAAVFYAPLVRSARWELSRLGFLFFGKFFKEVPRKKPSGSSDKNFLRFLSTDPLQCFSTPISWIRALFTWNERIRKLERFFSLPLLVIQGENDKVVDWQYNLDFLKRHFRQMKIHLEPRAGHLVLNESEIIRTPCIRKGILFFENMP